MKRMLSGWPRRIFRFTDDVPAREGGMERTTIGYRPHMPRWLRGRTRRADAFADAARATGYSPRRRRCRRRTRSSPSRGGGGKRMRVDRQRKPRRLLSDRAALTAGRRRRLGRWLGSMVIAATPPNSANDCRDDCGTHDAQGGDRRLLDSVRKRQGRIVWARTYRRRETPYAKRCWGVDFDRIASAVNGALVACERYGISKVNRYIWSNIGGAKRRTSIWV